MSRRWRSKIYVNFQSKHGSRISEERHFGDFGNIEANDNGEAHFEFSIPSGSSLFGNDSIYNKTLVIHKSEDDLGIRGNDGSMKTGNAGSRLACGVVVHKNGKKNGQMDNFIIFGFSSSSFFFLKRASNPNLIF